jgi:hypothetical protein
MHARPPRVQIIVIRRVAANSNRERICRRCHKTFLPQNGTAVCVYHTELFTGGEVGKFTGYVPPPIPLQRRKTGLVRFYDCCGARSEDAPGCVVGPHVPFDDDDGLLAS